MKIMYCWRCHQDMPMLGEAEYAKIYKLYRECFNNVKNSNGRSIDEMFLPLRQEYERMTGFADCHQNAIMHHRISRFGEPCKHCGKPLRTPKAKYCVYCGKEVEE